MLAASGDAWHGLWNVSVSKGAAKSRSAVDGGGLANDAPLIFSLPCVLTAEPSFEGVDVGAVVAWFTRAPTRQRKEGSWRTRFLCGRGLGDCEAQISEYVQFKLVGVCR